MSRHAITDKVSFVCTSCQKGNLLSDGAIRTNDNRIFVVFKCEDCRAMVPIELDKIVAELYSSELPVGSKMVN